MSSGFRVAGFLFQVSCFRFWFLVAGFFLVPGFSCCCMLFSRDGVVAVFYYGMGGLVIKNCQLSIFNCQFLALVEKNYTFLIALVLEDRF